MESHSVIRRWTFGLSKRNSLATERKILLPESIRIDEQRVLIPGNLQYLSDHALRMFLEHLALPNPP